MSCYPLDYYCPDDEMKEELETVNYRLTVDGLEFTPISGRKRTCTVTFIRRFLKQECSAWMPSASYFSCLRHILNHILHYGTKKSPEYVE